MKRVRILFLASNPAATPRLTLDEEAREIQAKIYAAEHRDAFEFITQWAVRPDDLLDALNRHRPHVVHFSGHGNDSDELILAGDDGQPRPVTKPALARLFRVLGQDVRVVVLNACYSRPQAEVIAEHVDCVVGMRRAIDDRAGVRFAASFYRALAFGRSVANAFDQGLVALDLAGTGASDIPDLVVRRASANPGTIVLAPGEDDTTPPPPPPGIDDSDPQATDTSRMWIPPGSNREAALQALLVDAFSGNPAGLLQWVRLALGPQIHNELPSSGGLTELAHQTMLAAGRHGRVDAAMFHSLRQERPALATRIQQVAQQYDIDLWQR